MIFEYINLTIQIMGTKKLSERQRGHMKLAYEVQQIASPYLKQGGYSLIKIYLNYVVKQVPICINTFRKMMKEDVSHFPKVVEEYQQTVRSQYEALLQKQSKKRIKTTKDQKRNNNSGDTATSGNN